MNKTIKQIYRDLLFHDSRIQDGYIVYDGCWSVLGCCSYDKIYLKYGIK
jgi:hypothetical protein